MDDAQKLPDNYHGLTFAQWRELGPAKAAAHTARVMGWDDVRRDKLAKLLAAEWGVKL